MDCLSCHAHVPQDARFCPACGKAQVTVCPQCRVENGASHRFCKSCGSALSRQGTDPHGAERRNLTVVFCDLVGSVAMSGALDPEDLRELIRDYQRVCADAVTRLDGHIAQYLGDGVLAYFGYPVAHEDDARRALRAGLAILQGMHPLAERCKRERGLEVRLRIGVHSGPSVIGEMGHGGTPLATGETPNLAARVQAAAEPDTLLVSAATEALVRGYFTLHPLGPVALKGRDEPMPLFRVLGTTGAASRLAALGDAALLPFVGRGSTLDLLLSRWAQAQQGQGNTVLLRGDPGIGKSRLLRAMRQRIVDGPPTRWQALEMQCSPYQQASAFAPVVEGVQRAMGIERAQTPQARTQAMVDGLAALAIVDPDEAAALLAPLLDVLPPEGTPPLQLTPQRQRRRTIETLAELLCAAARREPLMLAIEDLHWADPSTLELLDELVSALPDAPLMLVLTYRSEFVAPWTRRRAVHELVLDALPEEAARALVAQVAQAAQATRAADAGQGHGRPPLPADVLQRVLARAEGNPLYLEEITRVVVAAGAAAEATIPATVQESLLARIDRLGPAKPIAQLASALGRRFSFKLLAAMAAVPDAGLEQALQRLVNEDLLVQHGRLPDAAFTFKHALLQDAAYDSLLRSRRREIHERIGLTLLEQFPETCATQPELAARHLTEAGRIEQAVAYWRKAGELALARSAQAEAAAHLTRALELVRSLPMGAVRGEHELALLITLGPIQMAIHGYADPRVEQTYRDARALAQAAGDVPQIVPVLFGLWAYYVVRGSLAQARELADQIQRLLQEAGDTGMLLEAHVVRGVTRYFSGELPGARQDLERVLELYDPAAHRAHAQVFGQEPGMAAHVYLAKTLAVLGDADAAAAHAREAAHIAGQTAHFHTSCFCMAYEMVVDLLGERPHAVQATAARCEALAREQGFPVWEAAAGVLGARATFELGGSGDQVLDRMDRAIELWRATGTALYAPWWQALRAQTLAALGRTGEALAAIEAALAEELAGDERVSLAELHRVRAQLLWQARGADAADQVRASLDAALAVAEAQHAGLWRARAIALRATTGL